MSKDDVKGFAAAKEVYAAWGVDVDKALDALDRTPLALHCWQGDDVGGFENAGASLDGGLAATGNYPGKARTADELRADLEEALACCPGAHRVNLHALYAETDGKKVDRDELKPEHFARWTAWAKGRKIGLDFNPSFFSHPRAADGTLSSADDGVRAFWIRHAQACRKIGASFGAALGTACVTNVWIPDGSKDTPADRAAPRRRLVAALDEAFKEKIDPKLHLDAVECKLFGIGSESYVVGSHEFYLGYGLTRGVMPCFDAGHFHPTETLADKISAALLFHKKLLLHVSRGVRWDSDHVIALTDDLMATLREATREDYLGRIQFALDYFDASINRVAAWVIGARNWRKALLIALLEPPAAVEAERKNDPTGRFAYQEEVKTLPWAAVWDEYCRTKNAPVGAAWLDRVRAYEKGVLAKRG
jgi:L-rhamnose isomerase